MSVNNSTSIRRSSRRKLGNENGNRHECLNCGNTFTGTYCNSCGQHHNTRRLTTRELWDNIAFSFLNFDRGIPNTLYRLFTNPGKMIKDYIVGHRVNFSHPMALLILLCAVYGIVIGFVRAGVSGEVIEAQRDSFLGASDSAFLRMLDYMLYRMLNSTIFMAILPVPFFALVSRRLLRKYGSKKYNYAEMLFANIYMACQRMAVSILIDPFIEALPDVGRLKFLKYLIFVVLAAWTFRGMFPVKWGKAIWKSVLMFIYGWCVFGLFMIAFFVVVILIALIIVVIVQLIKGNNFNDVIDNANTFFSDTDIDIHL